jgi:hypothetical protein
MMSVSKAKGSQQRTKRVVVVTGQANATRVARDNYMATIVKLCSAAVDSKKQNVTTFLCEIYRYRDLKVVIRRYICAQAAVESLCASQSLGWRLSQPRYDSLWLDLEDQKVATRIYATAAT